MACNCITCYKLQEHLCRCELASLGKYDEDTYIHNPSMCTPPFGRAICIQCHPVQKMDRQLVFTLGLLVRSGSGIAHRLREAQLVAGARSAVRRFCVHTVTGDDGREGKFLVVAKTHRAWCWIAYSWDMTGAFHFIAFYNNNT